MTQIPDLSKAGQPQTAVLVLDNPDGTKSALPVVAIGYFSDGAMQTLANIVGTVVAQELDRRGLTALSATVKDA